MRPVPSRSPWLAWPVQPASWAPALAAGAALAALLAGLRGVDLAAAVYRIELFHRSGLVLWDSQWYGGHFTLDYSVLFPPVAAVLGVPAMVIAAVASAALVFDRLVVGHFGARARAGSLVFAAGTMAQVAIGQLPFLLGEALALAAFWAASRRRWAPALVAAVACSMSSPLAGSFLALGLTARTLTAEPADRRGCAAVLAATAAPLALSALLLPGQGVMPFPGLDFAWLLVLFGGAALLVPGRERGLRAGVLLYLAAIVASFVMPSPVGGDVSRLGECVGGALAACVLARRSWLVRLAVVVPLLALQWGPALTSVASAGGDPSTSRAYFAPLVAFLQAHDGPATRVEVVPTARHWEAAYIAPYVQLARGWERQLDVADNPLFYAPADTLTASAYRRWLLGDGVRFVALPDAPLDYAATAEAALIRAGVPGLRLVWRDRHWRVYAVAGSPGLVTGHASLVALGSGGVTLRVTAPGSILLRIRFVANWTVTTGAACLGPGPGGWIDLAVRRPGRVVLGLDPLPAATPPPGCQTSRP